MHRHDAGMIEIGDRASLGQIRLGIFGLRDQLGVRHLDGDQPIQLLVVSQIDETEAPFAQAPSRCGSDRSAGDISQPHRFPEVGIAGPASHHWGSIRSYCNWFGERWAIFSVKYKTLVILTEGSSFQHSVVATPVAKAARCQDY